MGFRNIFIVIIVCILLYLAFTAGPIIYRGVFGIRGICSEQVNRYKKYGSEFIFSRVEEEMTKIGVPDESYEYLLKVDDEKKIVVLEIYYEDTARFIGDYNKKFEFSVRCESGTKDVYAN